jgi:hypothetical protein
MTKAYIAKDASGSKTPVVSHAGQVTVIMTTGMGMRQLIVFSKIMDECVFRRQCYGGDRRFAFGN